MTARDYKTAAAYILDCAEQLQRQTAGGGWPESLRLPLPKSDAEYEALKQWLGELRQQAGRPFPVKFIPAGEP